MKKTVKCSGCGKEHEIEHTKVFFGDMKGHHSKEDITFKPVKSVRDRLFEDICRWHEKISCEGRLPSKLYLGKQEMDCMCENYNTIYGFEAVEVDKDSYFHATSKAAK